MDDYLKYQCDYYDNEPDYCHHCDTEFITKCNCNKFVKFFFEKKASFFALFEKKDLECPF